MRATLVLATLLWLVSSPVGNAARGESRYTTLVVEYAGEQDRYVFPVVISASSEEGEWYKQHLWPDGLVFVEVVPTSVLDEITELPLLKRQLERAKPVEDEPKTLMDVKFIAGVGHEQVQIIVTDQTGAKILKDIAGVVAKHSRLKSELQEIADRVQPLTFQNGAMDEIGYKPATEAGFQTRGRHDAHFGFTVFKLPNGNALTVYYDDFATPDEAKRFFDWKAQRASQVLWRDTKTDADGKPVGYRYRAESAPHGKRRDMEVMWVLGAAVHWIDAADLREAIELEGQYRYGPVECSSGNVCR